MQATKRLRAKTYILLLLMVSFGSTGDTLLSKGMKQLGEVRFDSLRALALTFLHTFGSPTIWLGIACLLGFFTCYLLVLSWADFSYVLPASAIGLVLVTLLAYLVLGETVTSTRWAGVALISVGVILVGRTAPRTTEPN